MMLMLVKNKTMPQLSLDMDLMKKLNKNIGSSETHGGNIGEKWDSLEFYQDKTSLVSKEMQDGPYQEPGLNIISHAEKMVQDVFRTEFMKTLQLDLQNNDVYINY